MKYLKSYDEKLNESVLVYGIIMLVYKLIKMILIINYKTYVKNAQRNIELEERLTNIIGSHKTKIYTTTDKKFPAGAAINQIFIGPKIFDVMTDRELMAVILHEQYHITNKHAIQYILFDILPVIGYMNLGSWLMAILIPLVSKYILNKTYFKNFEKNADNYAVKYGYGVDLSTALEKLSEISELTKLNKNNSLIKKIIYKIQKIFDKHPSVEDRINATLNNVDNIEIVINKEIKEEEPIKSREIEILNQKLKDGTISENELQHLITILEFKK